MKRKDTGAWTRASIQRDRDRERAAERRTEALAELASDSPSSRLSDDRYEELMSIAYPSKYDPDGWDSYEPNT